MIGKLFKLQWNLGILYHKAATRSFMLDEEKLEKCDLEIQMSCFGDFGSLFWDPIHKPKLTQDSTA